MTIKGGVWDKAQLRLLGPETEPPIHPTVLIWHTMVGGLRGTDSYFRQAGFTGDESTFGVGGPWDGAELDGAAWQWQYCTRQADAQFAGNAYAVSIENADGGHPTNPFSSKMMGTHVELGVDVSRAYDIPAQLVPRTGPVGKGYGYHELRHDWNLSGHVCPGPVREGQLRQIVIPKIRAILLGHTPAPTPKPVVQPTPSGTHDITVDGIFGLHTIAVLQHALGFTGSECDGIFGPTTRKRLQHHLGLRDGDVDGIIGPHTIKLLQAKLFGLHCFPAGTAWQAAVDGAWGHETTKALQRALNEGKF